MIVLSQANILNAKSPEEIGDKYLYDEVSADQGPLEYEFVDDKDVLFSKTIWEVISLDERVNFPMYYPRFLPCIINGVLVKTLQYQ